MIPVSHVSGKALVFILLLSGLPSAFAGSDTREFVGEARSLDNGELYYTEEHRQKGECRSDFWHSLEHEVSYLDPDGEVIAVKEMDYEHSSQRPSFRIEDKRFDEIMDIRNDEDRKVRIDWVTPDGDEKRFEESMPDNGVIDAGFEGLIRDNWTDFVDDGKKIRVKFLAPTRGSFYELEVSHVDSDKLDADYSFRIRSRGLFSRWFFDEIYLGYDEQRRLTDYYGLTNIRDTKDDNFKAHIRYEYSKTPDC